MSRRLPQCALKSTYSAPPASAQGSAFKKTAYFLNMVPFSEPLFKKSVVFLIASRSLCVRHLQTILPYSPYLHGIFTIYSNFTPPYQNLLLQSCKIFC